MEDPAVLELNGIFDYAGEFSKKVVAFSKGQIKVTGNNVTAAIKYTDINRISYNSKSVKIETRDGHTMKIPCSSAEIKKIKTLFKARREVEIKKVTGSALITIGDLHFVVPVKSNDVKDLKSTVLQRIAEHFYPACEASQISSETFGHLAIVCEMENGFGVQLVTNEDLDAALTHFGGRLCLTVRKREDVRRD